MLDTQYLINFILIPPSLPPFFVPTHDSQQWISKGILQKFIKITNAFPYLQANWDQIYLGGV